MDDLRAQLEGLSHRLGGGGTGGRAPLGPAARKPASPHRREFTATVRPGGGLPLGAANGGRDAPLGGLIAKMRDAEAAFLKEKGRLVLEQQREQRRRAKAEAELRRVQVWGCSLLAV